MPRYHGTTVAQSPAGVVDSSSGTSEANLDVNMVIVLAALLCALVGALSVNSIIHCVARWRRRRLSARESSAAGLGRGDLQQIPVAVFGADGRIRGTECPICLGEFEEGDDVRILPKCNHGFHVKCIDAWLVSHSSCPNCRHSILQKTTETGAGGQVRRPGNQAGQLPGDIIILIAAI